MNKVTPTENDVLQAKRDLNRLFSDPSSKDQVEAKNWVEGSYRFLLECKNNAIDPGDVASFLSQFSNSLSKLAKTQLFKSADNQKVLIQFARQFYQYIQLSLKDNYALNKKFSQEMSRLGTMVDNLEMPKPKF